jgi:7,8-dihydropterin-6-yl-methyl-4-(beta-D-ribofuranosyl)aminobenzene 5'-phosphate synthase
MKVTALIENTCAAGADGLTAEHGLSLHVEHGGTRLLFDTGASGAFADNAARLGIDLAAVDVAVLSHHHYDHGGGLRRFLEINSHAPIYLRGPAVADCHFKLLWKERFIGLDESLLRQHADRFRFVDERTTIAPGATILTQIDRKYPEPRGNRRIYVTRDGKRVRDDFAHELVLVLEVPGGLAVFTGCSHHGILNMVAAVTQAFPGATISAVFGGFHLVALPPFNFMSGSRREVRDMAGELLRLPVQRVYTGHCTGSHAYQVLKSAMGDRIEYIATGRTVAV